MPPASRTVQDLCEFLSRWGAHRGIGTNTVTVHAGLARRATHAIGPDHIEWLVHRMRR